MPRVALLIVGEACPAEPQGSIDRALVDRAGLAVGAERPRSVRSAAAQHAPSMASSRFDANQPVGKATSSLASRVVPWVALSRRRSGTDSPAAVSSAAWPISQRSNRAARTSGGIARPAWRDPGEGLGGGKAAWRRAGCPGRQVEGVAVPVQHAGEPAVQVAQRRGLPSGGEFERLPADLLLPGRVNHAAQCPGDQLGTETDTEGREVRRQPPFEQGELVT